MAYRNVAYFLQVNQFKDANMPLNGVLIIGGLCIQ